MRRIAFSKHHGLGNDFLVVDHRHAEPDLTPEETRALCDRHRGVGGDGVLLALAPRAGGDVRMEVHNADGSVPETCGNGIRCLAFWAARTLPELAGRSQFVVETGAGPARVQVSGDDPVEAEVRVEMGAPILDTGRMPLAGALAEGERAVEVPLDVAGRSLRLTAVSMGNPHAVVWDEVADADRLRLGPTLEHHDAFPEGVNVGFARAEGAGVRLAVWERGCGLTEACGTGACAAVVSGVVTGRFEAGREVPVDLPGGRLRVEVAPDLSQVWMTGPARRVYDGTVDLDDLPVEGGR